MKKLFLITCLLCLPVMAEEVNPNQEIQNTKSYTGVNYNRQDTKEVGRQVIVNDHSWFNININLNKEGALFQKKTKEGTQE